MANMTEAVAQGNLVHKPNLKDLEMVSDEEESEGADSYDDQDVDDVSEGGESDIEDDIGDSGESQEEEEDKKPAKKNKVSDVYRAPKLNAVAFEDAKDRKKRMKAEYDRKRLGKSSLVEELKREMEDAPEEVYRGGVAKKGKVNKFQDALEREEMEAFKRVSMSTKEKKALRNQSLAEMQDKLDTLDDDFAAIQSIVRRTETKTKDDAVASAEKDAASSKFAKSLKQFIEKPDKRKEKAKRHEQELQEKSRRREEKAARKLEAQKEFMQSKLKEVKELDKSITRNISRDMLKARGIVRKRKREDANPRVKKRRQYEKLVKVHKNRVQDFKDGKAQGLYSGEATGLRTGLIKSTKFN